MKIDDVIKKEANFWIVCPTKDDADLVFGLFPKDESWGRIPHSTCYFEDESCGSEYWEKYEADTAFNIKNGKIFSFGSRKNFPIWHVDHYYTINPHIEFDRHEIEMSISEEIAALEKKLADLKAQERKEQEEAARKERETRERELNAIQNAVAAFNEKYRTEYYLSRTNNFRPIDERVLDVVETFFK